MPFHLLDKVAADNESTKAVFEHFRNVATAGLVGAAGLWLTNHAGFSSFRGVVSGISGGALWLVALGLFQIAMANATHRLSLSSSWQAVLWLAYSVIVLGGFFGYAAMR